jgi:hypothetical protein
MDSRLRGNDDKFYFIQTLYLFNDINLPLNKARNINPAVIPAQAGPARAATLIH